MTPPLAPPRYNWLLNLEWFSYVEYVIQFVLNTCILDIHNRTHFYLHITRMQASNQDI